jgi:hypothetical protein
MLLRFLFFCAAAERLAAAKRARWPLPLRLAAYAARKEKPVSSCQLEKGSGHESGVLCCQLLF